jgi:anhydro-N-acetylmuramic acid kinase
MSGTSVDSIDAALVKMQGQELSLVDCLELGIPEDIRLEIASLSHSGDAEIERLGRLDRRLGMLFGKACLQLLSQAKVSAAEVRAIGSHGQTVRHRPPSASSEADPAFTLQIGDPNTIAEMTGICTVADFRRRDIAAGGEGAPLAPAFHAAVFSKPGCARAIVNIGGIANVSVLSNGDTSGFDCGAGNTLLDHWAQRQLGQAYDLNGSWAAEGAVDRELLDRLLAHPYLARSAPKSTGKETFNLDWLDSELAQGEDLDPQDVQATLAEFTAAGICNAIAAEAPPVEEVYVCGGGAANVDLMRRIYERIQPVYLGTTSELGCDPAWVEAAAFAWLAGRTLDGLSGNLPAVTGASGERILGAVYPGA